LIGSIPEEISLLTNTLYLLSLNSNPELVGTLPSQLGTMTGLTRLQISRTGVLGKIPTELASLSNKLKSLYLHRNQLNGKIPSQLAQLTHLKNLWLHKNALTGKIPGELLALKSTKDQPQMQKLEELYLDWNKLTGTIPQPSDFKDGEEVEQPSSGLGLLTANAKETITSLSNVKTLALDNNLLTGSIPSSFGYYYKMETLTLHNNSLTGSVPPEVCSLFEVGALKRLTVDCHKVECSCRCECPTEEIQVVDERPFYDTSTPDATPSGPVFESFSPETQQMILNEPDSAQALAFNWLYNQADAGSLSALESKTVNGTGRLRRQLAHGVERQQDHHRMTLEALAREQQKFALVTLFFATNGEGWQRNTNWLSYQVQECEWWSRFAKTCADEGAYESLNLRENGLQGSIPPEVGLLTNLGWLELEENVGLYSSIPSTLGELTHLYYLSLNKASLTGTIPTELGRLTNIKEMDLGNNQLVGNIPSELFVMAQGLRVSLANNTLAGSLPASIGQWGNVTELYLNGNQFTGDIPTTLGLLSNLELLYLYDNEFTGTAFLSCVVLFLVKFC